MPGGTAILGQFPCMCVGFICHVVVRGVYVSAQELMVCTLVLFIISGNETGSLFVNKQDRLPAALTDI